MDMTINRLPAKTWNWLHMNECELKDKNTENERFTIDCKVPSGIIVTETKERTLEQLKTGMGEDMSLFMKHSLTPIQYFQIPAKEQVVEPTILNFFHEDSVKAMNEIEIHAEEGSQSTFIMNYHSEKNSEGLLAIQTRIYAKKHSKVTVFQLQTLGDQVEHLNDIGGYCEEGATIEIIQIALGGKENYLGCHIELAEKESELKSHIAYMGKGTQRFDMNYVALHKGKKTKSNFLADGILEDQAFKLLRGTIDFKNGSAGSEGEEKEEVLLLGEDIVNQTIPLILCAEEDVQGNHGATIGKLDDEVLFYLCSRGMSKEEAQKMIARAKIDAVCRRVPDEASAQYVQQYLEEVDTHESLS